MIMATEHELEDGVRQEKGKRIGRLEYMIKVLTGESGIIFPVTYDITEQDILDVANNDLTRNEQLWYAKLGVFCYRTDLKDYEQQEL